MPVHGKEKLCFVIGPIGSDNSEVRIHADWLLEEIIQPAMADFPEYEVKRADQEHRPGLIDAQLINDLQRAELVIADLSTHNPNVFYEIGIRHMAQKPIIHMQLADEKIPFDISLFRAIKFSRVRPKDIRTARDALKRQVEAIHADGYQVENPVTRAGRVVKLEARATPGPRAIQDMAQRASATEQSTTIEQLTLSFGRPRIYYIRFLYNANELKALLTLIRETVNNSVVKAEADHLMVTIQDEDRMRFERFMNSTGFPYGAALNDNGEPRTRRVH
jgi:hypothetical protein